MQTRDTANPLPAGTFRSLIGSLLAGLRRREMPRPAAATSVFIEALETRVMLSAVHRATPHFIVDHQHDSFTNTPAVVSAPSGLSPSDIRHAYGLDAVSFDSIGGDGTGQTIAIVSAYNAPNIVSDLHQFDLQFGLPDPQLTIINQNGTSTRPRNDPAGRGDSWALETSLDVQWAHAAAPGADILLVLANSASETNLLAAVNTARNYAGVSVVSMSWGEDEYSGMSSFDSTFTTPAGHNGVTFVASSGDNGAFSANSTFKSPSFPAVSPNVVSVGGTTLSVTAAGNYLSETGWGSGVTSGSQGGSGGGISRFVLRPTYQSGVTQTSNRTVPDIAMDADPNSGVAVYDSWDSPTSPWSVVGGTSLAAPLWAGTIAIANQGRTLAGLNTLDGPTQTLPGLYALPATAFHDVTSGNNGFAAGLGYDMVTGRGTPRAGLLIPGLVSGATPAAVPTIGSFTASDYSIAVGATITLTASSVESHSTGAISSVAFYREASGAAGLQPESDVLLGYGNAGGSTWNFSVSGASLAGGVNTIYAVATDTLGLSSLASVITVNVLVAGPVNDNFASGTVITGTSGTFTGSTVSASKEAGEASHAGNSGGKSVWFTWTAANTGRVSLSTSGSDFDTTLAVYTGDLVASTTTVASNDDAVTNLVLTSALSFSAVAGVTYHIAIDGYASDAGNYVLSLNQAVAAHNDKFAAATPLTGSVGSITGSNIGATRESGEPLIAKIQGGASVWFTWTAPVTRTMRLNTDGSNFDTLLGVYTGSSLNSLTRIAANDDQVTGLITTSSVTFRAVAGRTYRIAIDGYKGATGLFQLNFV